ncbi:septum formation initiator family protein (plasmid) [Rossellomorea sp. AcN35-11]|nr:septum formation initiator family protein [Rossellomorea aquimaris]WJV32216.1 septum formation initiator family protein [Rossellomorea sp. AcN35-11]
MYEKSGGVGRYRTIKFKKNVLIPILFLITTSSFVSLFLIKNNDVKEMREQQDKLVEELAHLEESEVLLRNEIEKLKDPQYVANLARQDYYLSKEDELIFRIK